MTAETERAPSAFDTFDPVTFEAECRDLWRTAGVYRFDPDGPGEVFSVDTPPPYVSASHLHVGHAMSYSQAEFVVRYQRMKGRRVYYPMGFDDNGLPTERYVEQAHGIDKRKTTRAAFRALCLEETQRGARTYRDLWNALGLSVDWTLSYSTIDDHCRRTAQWSFLDLHAKGRLYRANEPVLWDPRMETALAQADLEFVPRDGELHEIAFGEARIATTRPELLPACVALYLHPDDSRWRHLLGHRVTVPLADRDVPVLTDPEVDPAFGTGLMMVCTFGDAMDVHRWRRDGLENRLIIGPDGRMLPAAGPLLEGLTVARARETALAALRASGALVATTSTTQLVPTAERSGAPVELLLRPQWLIRVLDLQPALLARSAELRWHPTFMKPRLDQWIQGLQWDWNISRQRFYGVPIPAWSCAGCGEVVLARIEDLPVDPLENAPPVSACPRCSGALIGDPDVMDTWMTSSVTPLVLANRAGTAGRTAGPTPMTVRVQAHEIVRTWLFYTVVKSELHDGALPWRDVMISGWGLDERGKKISKRSLEKTAADGTNRYDPHAVIGRYGADALRWWAASSHLGHDMRYDEQEVRAGRKLAMKLWNAARFAEPWLEGWTAADAPPPNDREPEDRWLLARIDEGIRAVTAGFESYDYATGRETLERLFWADTCDDWLELVKDRLHRPDRHPERAVRAARATLAESLRALLGLFAPYVPFTTEAIWQRLFRRMEGGISLHVTRFPEPRGEATVPAGIDALLEILRSARAARTAQRVPQSRRADAVTLDRSLADLVEVMPRSILAAARAERIALGEGPLRLEFTSASTS